ncbi:MAG: L,D-transpeptidase family protein [Sedimentisphaerales bacterium]
MARYSLPWPSRRRGRNRIYIIISAVLTVAIVVVLIYGLYPVSKSDDEPVEFLPETNVKEPESVEDTEEIEKEIIPSVPPLAMEVESEPNLITLASKPPTQTNLQMTELIAEAMALVNEKPGKIIEARDRLNDALLMPMSAQQRAFVKEQLSKLAEQWLFSKSLFPNDKLCSSYKVKPGDQLRIIGQRYKVPYEILVQINNIRHPKALQAGQTIKVINGPFHAKVYRSTFTMDLYLQNTFVRSFPVGLGQPGMETPTGLWRVKANGKLVKPVWTNPLTGRTYHPQDADYPLGSRWIALEGLEGPAKYRTGFAIHGTKEPDQIGTAGSQGCIRLHNGDAILLYNLLVPIHSLVRVEE